jgi:hypothetical protein
MEFDALKEDLARKRERHQRGELDGEEPVAERRDVAPGKRPRTRSSKRRRQATGTIPPGKLTLSAARIVEPAAATPVVGEPVPDASMVTPAADEALVAEGAFAGEALAAEGTFAEEAVAVEAASAEEPLAAEGAAAEEPVAVEEVAAAEPVEEVAAAEPLEEDSVDEDLLEEDTVVEEPIEEETVVDEAVADETVAPEPGASPEPVPETAAVATADLLATAPAASAPATHDPELSPATAIGGEAVPVSAPATSSEGAESLPAVASQPSASPAASTDGEQLLEQPDVDIEWQGQGAGGPPLPAGLLDPSFELEEPPPVVAGEVPALDAALVVAPASSGAGDPIALPAVSQPSTVLADARLAEIEASSAAAAGLMVPELPASQPVSLTISAYGDAVSATPVAGSLVASGGPAEGPAIMPTAEPVATPLAEAPPLPTDAIGTAQTPTQLGPAPQVPTPSDPGGDGLPSPDGLRPPTPDLSGDAAALAAGLSAEAGLSAQVPADGAALVASDVTPLAEEMAATHAEETGAPYIAVTDTHGAQTVEAEALALAQYAAADELAAGQATALDQMVATDLAGASALLPPEVLTAGEAAVLPYGPQVEAVLAPLATPTGVVAVSPASIVAFEGAALAVTADAGARSPELAGFAQLDVLPEYPELEAGLLAETRGVLAAETQVAAGALAAVTVPALSVAPTGGAAGSETAAGGVPTRAQGIAEVEAQISAAAQDPALLQPAWEPMQAEAAEALDGAFLVADRELEGAEALAVEQWAQVVEAPPPVTAVEAEAEALAGYLPLQEQALATAAALDSGIAEQELLYTAGQQAIVQEHDARLVVGEAAFQEQVVGAELAFVAAGAAEEEAFIAGNLAAQSQWATDSEAARLLAQGEIELAGADYVAAEEAAAGELQGGTEATYFETQVALDGQLMLATSGLVATTADLNGNLDTTYLALSSQVAEEEVAGNAEVAQCLADGQADFAAEIDMGCSEANVVAADARAEADALNAQAAAQEGEQTDYVGQALTWVRDQIDGLLQAAIDVLNWARQQVVGIMKAARDAAMGVLQIAREAALAIVEGVKDVIAGLIAAAADAVRWLIALAAEAIRQLIQELADAIKGIIGLLTLALLGLVEAFRLAVNLAFEIFQALAPLLLGQLGVTLAALAESHQQRFNELCDAAQLAMTAAALLYMEAVQAAADGYQAQVTQWEAEKTERVDQWEAERVAALEAWYAEKVAAINQLFDQAEALVEGVFLVATALVELWFELQIAQLQATQDWITEACASATEWLHQHLPELNEWIAATQAFLERDPRELFLDFWNSPWRDAILIGLVTVAAVAIVTIATGGVGAPIALAIAAGIIGAAIGGAVYYAGETAAQQSEISLAEDTTDIYLHGGNYFDPSTGEIHDAEGNVVATADELEGWLSLGPEEQAELELSPEQRAALDAMNNQSTWAFSIFEQRTPDAEEGAEGDPAATPPVVPEETRFEVETVTDPETGATRTLYIDPETRETYTVSPTGFLVDERGVPVGKAPDELRAMATEVAIEYAVVSGLASFSAAFGNFAGQAAAKGFVTRFALTGFKETLSRAVVAAGVEATTDYLSSIVQSSYQSYQQALDMGLTDEEAWAFAEEAALASARDPSVWGASAMLMVAAPIRARVGIADNSLWAGTVWETGAEVAGSASAQVISITVQGAADGRPMDEVWAEAQLAAGASLDPVNLVSSFISNFAGNIAAGPQNRATTLAELGFNPRNGTMTMADGTVIRVDRNDVVWVQSTDGTSQQVGNLDDLITGGPASPASSAEPAPGDDAADVDPVSSPEPDIPPITGVPLGATHDTDAELDPFSADPDGDEIPSLTGMAVAQDPDLPAAAAAEPDAAPEVTTAAPGETSPETQTDPPLDWTERPLRDYQGEAPPGLGPVVHPDLFRRHPDSSVDPSYHENQKEASAFFSDFLFSGDPITGESLLEITVRMHEIAAVGMAGDRPYQGRKKEGTYLDYSSADLSHETWRTPGQEVPQHYVEAAKHLNDALDLPPGSQAFVDAVSDYYHAFTSADPFAHIGNALFTTQVNTLLRAAGHSGIMSQWLDYHALYNRPGQEAFRPQFQAQLSDLPPRMPEPSSHKSTGLTQEEMRALADDEQPATPAHVEMPWRNLPPVRPDDAAVTRRYELDQLRRDQGLVRGATDLAGAENVLVDLQPLTRAEAEIVFTRLGNGDRRALPRIDPNQVFKFRFDPPPDRSSTSIETQEELAFAPDEVHWAIVLVDDVSYGIVKGDADGVDVSGIPGVEVVEVASQEQTAEDGPIAAADLAAAQPLAAEPRGPDGFVSDPSLSPDEFDASSLPFDPDATPPPGLAMADVARRLVETREGQAFIHSPEGRQVLATDAGRELFLTAAGVDFFLSAEGMRILATPDGQRVLLDPVGQRFLMAAEGQMLLRTEAGRRLLFTAEGQALLMSPELQDFLASSRGLALLRSEEAAGLLLSPDGQRLLSTEDGRALLLTPLGRSLLNSPEGMAILLDPEVPALVATSFVRDLLSRDTSLFALTPEGQRHLFGPQGKQLLGTPEGQAFLAGDGAQFLTSPAGRDMLFTAEGQDFLFGPEGQALLAEARTLPPPARDDLGTHLKVVPLAGSLFATDDSGGPEIRITDVTQGGLGDCYFIADLISLAGARPDLIQGMVRESGGGAFEVTFHSPAGDTVVTVDTRVFTYRDGFPLYARPGTSGGTSPGPILWGPIIEKAWAALNGSHDRIIGGGDQVVDSHLALTGQPATTLATADLSVDDLGARLQAALDSGQPVTVSSLADDSAALSAAGVIARHAYSLIAGEGGTFTLFNPWGRRHLENVSPAFIREHFARVNLLNVDGPALAAGSASDPAPQPRNDPPPPPRPGPPDGLPLTGVSVSVPPLDESARVLNIGSGRVPVPGAINLDIDEASNGLDLVADALHAPFAPGSFDRIRAMRLPGPLVAMDDYRLVREIHRLLRVGGTVDLSSISGFSPVTRDVFERVGFDDVTLEHGGQRLLARKGPGGPETPSSSPSDRGGPDDPALTGVSMDQMPPELAALLRKPTDEEILRRAMTPDVFGPLAVSDAEDLRSGLPRLEEGAVWLASGEQVHQRELTPDMMAWIRQNLRTPSPPPLAGRKVVVDGGGPAGALAAIQAYLLGLDVTIIEQRDSSDLPIVWNNRQASRDVAKLIDSVLEQRLFGEGGVASPITFMESTRDGQPTKVTRPASRAGDAHRALNEPAAIAGSTSAFQTWARDDVNVYWDRLHELARNEAEVAAREGREPRLKLLRGHAAVDLPVIGDRRGIVVQKVVQRLQKQDPGNPRRPELGADGMPITRDYQEGDPIPAGWRVARVAEGELVDLGVPDDLLIAEGVNSQSRDRAGVSWMEIGPSAQFMAAYLEGFRIPPAEGAPEGAGGIRARIQNVPALGEGRSLQATAVSAEHLTGAWGLPEIDPRLDLKDPASIEAYFGHPMSEKQAILAYWKQQIAPLLGVDPGAIPDDAFIFGPGPFLLQSHVAGRPADDATNVHLIGEARGNSHFFTSLGKVTGTGTHQLSLRQFWTAIATGFNERVARAMLDRRLDAGTLAWIKAGLPAFDKPHQRREIRAPQVDRSFSGEGHPPGFRDRDLFVRYSDEARALLADAGLPTADVHLETAGDDALALAIRLSPGEYQSLVARMRPSVEPRDRARFEEAARAYRLPVDLLPQLHGDLRSAARVAGAPAIDAFIIGRGSIADTGPYLGLADGPDRSPAGGDLPAPLTGVSMDGDQVAGGTAIPAAEALGGGSANEVARPVGDQALRELGIDPAGAVVNELDGGFSTATLYTIDTAEGRLLLKIFPDLAEARAEAEMLARLGAAVDAGELTRVTPVRLRAMRPFDRPGAGPGGMVLMAWAPGGTLAVRAGGDGDVFADLARAAEGLADLHQAFATGQPMSVEAKREAADRLFRRMEDRRDQFGDLYEPLVEAMRRDLVPAFERAEVPETVHHGDANTRNFLLAGDDLYVIDVGGMSESLDAAGRPIGTAAADVARMKSSLDALRRKFPERFDQHMIEQLKRSFTSAYEQRFQSTRGWSDAERFYLVQYGMSVILTDAPKTVRAVDNAKAALRELLGLPATEIRADDFPMPDVVRRVAIDPATERPIPGAFQESQAAIARARADQLARDLAAAETPEQRQQAMEDAFMAVHFDLIEYARSTSTDEGKLAKMDRLIPEGDPNNDPWGDMSLKERTEDGEPTYAARQMLLTGNEVLARFARFEGNPTAEARLSEDGEVLQNVVRLPDGTSIDGNRMLRGSTADAIDADKGRRYGYPEAAERLVTQTGEPQHMRVLHDAGIATLADLAAQPGPDPRERFSDAAYYLYQGLLYNRGGDATIRTFLAAAGQQIFGRSFRFPQDIDLRAFVLSQSEFRIWMTDQLRGVVPPADRSAHDPPAPGPTGWLAQRLHRLWSRVQQALRGESPRPAPVLDTESIRRLESEQFPVFSELREGWPGATSDLQPDGKSYGYASAGTVEAPFAAEPDRVEDAPPSGLEALRPEVADLVRRLPLVHATRRFPADGKVLAGRVGEDAASRPSLALLTHWAAGGLVPGHLAADWESAPFAVIVPFEKYADRAVNFFAQDTALLGDVELSAEALVIVRADAEVPANLPFRLARLHPNESLRPGIDRILREEGYAQVSMERDTGMSGDPAFHDQVDINHPSYVEELRRGFPGLAVGSPMMHPLHQTDFQFYAAVNRVLDTSSPSLAPESFIANTLIAARANLDLIRGELGKLPAGDPVQALAQRRLADSESWLGLLEVELELRRVHGLTLKGKDASTSGSLLNGVIADRADPKAVRARIDAMLASPEARARQQMRDGSGRDKHGARWAYMLQHLSLDEFRDLSPSFDRTGWDAENVAGTTASYVLERLIRVDVPPGERADLLRYLDQAAAELSLEARAELVQAMWRWPIHQYTSLARRDRAADFEAVINLPSLQADFRALIKRLSDRAEVPDSGPLRFEEIMRPLRAAEFEGHYDRALEAARTIFIDDGTRSVQVTAYKLHTGRGAHHPVTDVRDVLLGELPARRAAVDQIVSRHSLYGLEQVPDQVAASYAMVTEAMDRFSGLFELDPEGNTLVVHTGEGDVRFEQRGEEVLITGARESETMTGLDAVRAIWAALGRGFRAGAHADIITGARRSAPAAGR